MKTILKLFLVIIFIGCNLVNAQNYNEILGRPTDTSITVSVMFDQTVSLYLVYGTVSGVYTDSTTTISNTINKPDEIVLHNLISNTRYYYRTRYSVTGSGTLMTSNEHTFHTQRAIGSTFTFDVEADEHLYDYGDPTLYNYTEINEAHDNPDFLITLGDIFGDDHYPWTITSQECDSLHYVYRARLGTICHSIPFYICLGNHEGEKDYYLDSMPPNNIAIWSTLWRKYYYPNPNPNNFYTGDTIQEGYGIGLPQNYYAWTWGNALFVVLDAYRNDCYNEDTTTTPKPDGWDWTLGLNEYTWLKNTLEGSTAQYKFVFAHHVSGETRGGIIPAQLYEWGGNNKNGTPGFTAQRPGWAKPIHQLFHDNGVNIFFQGHDHLFAHEVLDSVTYQEVPMAADPTYTKGMLANGAAYTADTIDASGHIRVTVSPSCVQVDYVRAWLPADTLSGVHHNGEVAFSYTIGNCSTAGINAITEKPSVKVYPNPANDKITIEFDKTNALSNTNVFIYDLQGQLLIQQPIIQQKTELNIDDLAKGMYIVKVKNSNNNTSVSKFVKE